MIIDPQRWDEVQAAFDALVELSPAARASQLEALEATDPVLYASVAALLAADANAEAQLAPLDAILPSVNVPDPLGLSGRTVAHFRVLEPLGAGGMGVVYRAEDANLGRAVALKFLLPHFGLDTNAKARFLREARSAAALDHPNLCTIHEVGESQDGRLFLAMALYPGETLKERLAREGSLPIPSALDITRQIALGLGCAHAAGIVHRDLKPGNVMVLPDSTVKILDFGLARSRDEIQSGGSARWGTAAYMAPEQVMGQAVDARTDLWALGVVLYEMVTGKKPFGEGHEISIAHAILQEEPVPPSRLVADADPHLEHIILTLLEKDPARRLANASAVIDILTAPGRTGAPLWRRRVRRRLFVGLAAVAALAAGAAGIRLARSGGAPAPPASPTRIAVFPFSVPTEFVDLSEGLMDLVSRSLDGAGELRSVDPNLVMSRLRQGRNAGVPELEAARSMAQELGSGHFVLGRVVRLQGRVQLSASLYSLSRGTEPDELSTHQGDLKNLSSLVDSVSHDLLTKLPAAQGAFSTQTGGSTPSYAALRDYARGVALMRRAQWDSAAICLVSAVREDSTFASAWLHLAESRSYEGAAVGPMITTWDKAYELRDRLSPRERAWLLAGRAFAHGDGRGADKAALAMVNAYPDAIVGWFYLGDGRLWYAWQLGRAVTEADSALERALRLDPQSRILQNELSVLRYAEGRKAEGDSLWRAFSDVAVPPEDSAGRRQYFAKVESESRNDVVNRAWLIPEMTDSLRDATRLPALLTDSRRGSESDPAVGHHLAAWVEVARGRWFAADSEFARTAALDARMGVVEQGWLGAVPAFGRDTKWLRRTRAALLAWTPRAGPDIRYLFDWRLAPWMAPPAKVYVLGLLSARLGDSVAALRYAAQLDAAREPRDSLGLFHDLALEVRALGECERELWQTCLATLERQGLRGQAPIGEDQASPFNLRAFGRFLRAEALFHLDHNREALGWYGTFWLHTEFPLFAPVQLREGEIYEREGNSREAAAHYRRFLARWQDADAEYQPLVWDVAARVARLTGERRP